ncbi:MAG: glycoside hydrolase [Paramuribaculum sp.]|nr:glycoside hydrolase [Paramuribaculum sp.]
MKKTITTLALATIFAASGVAAAAYTAASEDSKSVTVSVSEQTGTLWQSKTSSFYARWNSNSTDPAITIANGADANNVQFKNSHLVIYTGTLAAGKQYTVTPSEGWRVSAMEMEMKSYDITSSVTVSCAGESVSITPSAAAQTISATFDEDTPATFSLNGENKGVEFVKFDIVCTRVEGSVTNEGPVRLTTVVDGQFAPGTTFYTLQIGSGGLRIDAGNETNIPLQGSRFTFEDKELWCFAGNSEDGYIIYNRAEGPSKLLASPKTISGSGDGVYPVLKAEGDNTYEYRWDLIPANDLSGKTAYYLTQHGKPANAVNNFGGKGVLAFWTTGKDSGSCVQIIFALQTLAVNPAAGTVADDNAKWTSAQGKPALTITTDNGSIAAPAAGLTLTPAADGSSKFTFATIGVENAYVESVEFKVANSGHSNPMTIEAGNKSVTTSATPAAFSIEGLDLESEATITVSGGNNAVVLTDINVTMRRNNPVKHNIDVFVYDGSPEHKIQYRIPSISTVGAGTHAGRLLAFNDYRHQYADIGMADGAIDQHLSYSDDGGKTWSTPGLMVDGDGNPVSKGTGLGTKANSNNHPENAYSDPCSVGDRESGDVLLMTCGGAMGFWASRRNSPQMIIRWYSHDGGDTWTKSDNELTEQFYSLFDNKAYDGAGVDGMFVGSGKIHQSRYYKFGSHYRLYCAISTHNNGKNTRNYVLYSDDFGKNWNVLGDPAKAPINSNGDEPKVEELPDGSVMLIARGNGGNRNYNIFAFTDPEKAEGKWFDTHVNAGFLGENVTNCNGEPLMVPAKNNETGELCYILLQSHPKGPGRANVGVYWKVIKNSDDASNPTQLANNWQGFFQLTDMGSAYSTMSMLLDGSIGVIFEEETYGKAYTSVYRNLTLDQITGGLYSYTSDEDGSVSKAVADNLNILFSQREAELSQYLASDGTLVGQVAGDDLTLLKDLITKYLESRDSADLAKIDELLNNSHKVVGIVEGMKYTISNAHYAEVPGQSHLITIGSARRVISTSEPSDDCYFEFVACEDNPDQYLIKHSSSGNYFPKTPAVETVMRLVEKESQAAPYKIVSLPSGESAIVCQNPTNATYPAIHMGGDQSRIVTWQYSYSANHPSYWYIMPADPENSIVSGVENVAVDKVDNAPVVYFDVTGRKVATLRRGQLYIGSDGSKIVVR